MATISISLPTNDLLIKAGQKVDFSSPLTHKASADSITLNIASELGIPPQQIFRSVKKVVGDSLKKGELLAQKKSLLATRDFRSPFAGIIKEINHEDGTIVVEAKQEAGETLNAYFKGEVQDVSEGEVKLKVKSAKEYELDSATGSFGGEYEFLSSEDTGLTEDKVDGKVIFKEDIKPYELIKLEALGAKGFVEYGPLDGDSKRMARLKKSTKFSELKNTHKTYCIIDHKKGTLYLYD